MMSCRSVPLYRCKFGKWRPSRLSKLTIEPVSRFARTSVGVPAFPDSFVSSILEIFKRYIYMCYDVLHYYNGKVEAPPAVVEMNALIWVLVLPLSYFFFAQQHTWADGPNLTNNSSLRRPITYISTQSCLFESRGPIAQIWQIRVCFGPSRTFLHSRVHLSPVGRAPTFRGRPPKFWWATPSELALPPSKLALPCRPSWRSFTCFYFEGKGYMYADERLVDNIQYGRW
jgi:hypothetical protein